MRRGHRTEAHDVHLITASIARDLIHAAVGSLGALHARVAQAPETAMLDDFLQSMVRHAPPLDDRQDRAFARAPIELGGPRDVAVEARRQDHLRREAVEQLIDRAIACTSAAAESPAMSDGAGSLGRVEQPAPLVIAHRLHPTPPACASSAMVHRGVSSAMP